MRKQQPGRKNKPSGWDPVAEWYNGWVGRDGSEHHQKLAVPAVVELLALQPGQSVLDCGAGQGVLAPAVAAAGASYTGVDISPRLVDYARQHHGQHGRFIVGDVRQLQRISQLSAGQFDAAVFLLSIQDIDPLQDALAAAAWALRDGGQLVILMTHPCFRVPRQSGWGFDEGRSLQYRRVDHYLTPLRVPMKAYGSQRSGVTISFHRPLEDYVNGLAACGLLVNAMREIPTYKKGKTRAEARAQRELPLFMALRACKVAEAAG